jgi:hypothetical protein
MDVVDIMCYAKFIFLNKGLLGLNLANTLASIVEPLELMRKLTVFKILQKSFD